jgi:hypothetical protein
VSDRTDEQKSVSLQLRVRPDTRTVIDDLKDASGATAVEMVSRLLDWYAAQPKSVRRAILDREDVNAEIARLKLIEMENFGKSSSVTAKMDINEAVRVIRAMADRIEIQALAHKPRGK